MSLPNVSTIIKDGALGLQPPAATGIFAVVGVSSKHNKNLIQIISDPESVTDKLGDGPLRDLAASALALAKTTIYVVAVEGTQAGSISGVTKQAANNYGEISAAGSPRNEYDIRLEILSDGGLNEGSFRYIIDELPGERITIPATGTYEIPDTGIILTFQDNSAGAGTPFTKGDIFIFSTTAPVATNQEILEAVELLLNSRYSFEFVAMAGITAAPLWAALAARMELAAQQYRYVFAVCQARNQAAGETIDEWVAALTGAERGTTTSIRLQVCAGWIEEADSNGQTDERGILGAYCGMLARRKEHEPVDAVKYGSIPVATGLLPEGTTDGHIEVLKNAGYVTARHITGLTGVYITSGQLMSEATSDFNTVERIRVMNKACKAVRNAQLYYLNDTVEIGADGSLAGIAMFQVMSEQPLNQMKMDGQISGFQIIIPEGQDILATETIKTKVRIIPKGKMAYIENEISFHNPLAGGAA